MPVDTRSGANGRPSYPMIRQLAARLPVPVSEEPTPPQGSERVRRRRSLVRTMGAGIAAAGVVGMLVAGSAIESETVALDADHAAIPNGSAADPWSVDPLSAGLSNPLDADGTVTGLRTAEPIYGGETLAAQYASDSWQDSLTQEPLATDGQQEIGMPDIQAEPLTAESREPSMEPLLPTTEAGPGTTARLPVPPPKPTETVPEPSVSSISESMVPPSRESAEPPLQVADYAAYRQPIAPAPDSLDSAVSPPVSEVAQTVTDTQPYRSLAGERLPPPKPAWAAQPSAAPVASEQGVQTSTSAADRAQPIEIASGPADGTSWGAGPAVPAGDDLAAQELVPPYVGEVYAAAPSQPAQASAPVVATNAPEDWTTGTAHSGPTVTQVADNGATPEAPPAWSRPAAAQSPVPDGSEGMVQAPEDAPRPVGAGPAPRQAEPVQIWEPESQPGLTNEGATAAFTSRASPAQPEPVALSEAPATAQTPAEALVAQAAPVAAGPAITETAPEAPPEPLEVASAEPVSDDEAGPILVGEPVMSESESAGAPETALAAPLTAEQVASALRLDWSAHTAYMQMGAYASPEAAQAGVSQVETQLDLYRRQFPGTSFERMRVLTHKGQDGVYRVFADHFDSFEDAGTICRLFQQDFGQACFPVRKEAMVY